MDEDGPRNSGWDYRYAWRYGWTWVLSRIRQGQIVPTLREAYWVLLRGYIGETCGICARPYFAWWAPTDLWEQFSDGHGLLCPSCFDRLATRQGTHLKWRPERYPGT